MLRRLKQPPTSLQPNISTMGSQHVGNDQRSPIPLYPSETTVPYRN
jgi:hypothetical protein